MTARWGNECVGMVGKAYKSCLVGLAHSHIRQHERGIYGIVEQSHALERLLHRPALVDDRHYLLRPLVLVDIHHKLMSASRCLPVERTVVVALHIFLYTLKLSVVASTAYALHAHLGKAVVHGKQLILMEHEIRGIDLGILRFAACVATLGKRQSRPHKHTYSAKAIHPTLRGAQLIHYCLALAWLQPQQEVNVATLKHKRSLVDDS